MRILRIALIVLTVSLLLTIPAATLSAAGPKSSAVSAGSWGGEHIGLVVTTDGADIEFDCAVGHINAPLTLDANGRFRVKGTYRFERPAAAFVDDSAGTEVVYAGTVKGNTLRLEVEFPGQSEHKKFQLMRGQEPHLTKCA